LDRRAVRGKRERGRTMISATEKKKKNRHYLGPRRNLQSAEHVGGGGKKEKSKKTIRDRKTKKVVLRLCKK